MKYIACDTETELIAPRRYVAKIGRAFCRFDKGDLPDHHECDNKPPKKLRKIFTEPFTPPRLVVGSYSEHGGETGVEAAVDFLPRVRRYLEDPDTHVIWHNVAFDYQVLVAYDPSINKPFLDAAADGRVHDTMFLDLLYRLAQGDFDRPFRNDKGKWQREEVRYRGLDKLAKVYAGLELNKDASIRLTFGDYLGREQRLSQQHLRYAAEDALATLSVFMTLSNDGRELYGEPTQVRAALACTGLDQRGVRVNRDEAEVLRKQFAADVEPLQHQLVEEGLGRWEPDKETQPIQRKKVEHDDAELHAVVHGGAHQPKTWSLYNGRLVKWTLFKKHARLEWAIPKFVLNEAEIRTRLSGFETKQSPPITKTGLLSLDSEWWADYIPQSACGLRTWVEYEKLIKILTAYLLLYSTIDEVYPRWNVLGARSGRMSSSNPNLQNIPKRKRGIRSLFIPRPGRVFVVADYSTMELLTLAEVMVNMGIRGPLIDTIQAEKDVHYKTASFLLEKPVEDVTKLERQAAKAINFGVPGGLGAKTLIDYAKSTYGVTLTLGEAKRFRKRYLEAYPDVNEFLQVNQGNFAGILHRATGRTFSEWQIRTGCETAWDLRQYLRSQTDNDTQEIWQAVEHSMTTRLPGGRVRSKCRFTEAANTHFQGLASDVTKEAMFKCHQAGLDLVLVVHDELVVECDREDATVVAPLLEQCMLRAFVETCPIVGPYAKVEVEVGLPRWGASTDKDGKEVSLVASV